MSLRTRQGLAVLASLMMVVAACGGGTTATTAPAATSAAPAATTPAPAATTPAPAATTPAAGETSAPPAETSAPPAETSAPPAETSAPPAAGGELIYATDGQITVLTNGLGDVPTAEAVQWFYNALYTYDASLTPIPDLATELATVSEDGLTWTIDINTAATFQPGGKKLTADDVVFTYEMSNSPECRFNPSVCLANVLLDTAGTPTDTTDDKPVLESVTKIDDDTVEFKLIKKYAPFATVTLPGTLIDSKEAVEAAFAKYQAASGQVPAADIKALADKIAAENEKEEPNLVPLRAEIEALLTAAAIENVPQPNPETYPALGEDGNPTGELDEAAYVGAIVDVFNDLAASSAAEGIDAIAAAYKLLEISRKPVGTGPFYVTNFLPGERIEGARNDAYHNGPPALEKIFIPIITDDVAGAQALAAGQVDWKFSMGSQAYAAVQGNPNVKIAEYADFGYFGLQFNLREGKLFADKNLRQAVAYCAQKEQIVESATQGLGVPIYADIPPASWAYNADVPKFEFNPDTGKQLIESSGWTAGGDGVYEKDGKKLATTVLVRAGRPDRIAFMTLLSDQLNANCGFQMDIKEVDFGTVLVPMLSWPHAQQGKAGTTVVDKQFDAYFGGWSTGFDPDPFSLWHSSSCSSEANPDLSNYICYKDPEQDARIEAGLEELDQAKRAEIYKDFEAKLADDVPYLFAWSDKAREGVNARLNGAEPWTPENMTSPTWFYQFEKINKAAQ